MTDKPGLPPSPWLYALTLKNRIRRPAPREKYRARRLMRLMRRQAESQQNQQAQQRQQHRLRKIPSVFDLTPDKWMGAFTVAVRQPLHTETRLANVYTLAMAMEVWVDAVPNLVEFNEKYTSMSKVSLPVKGARMIIAPKTVAILCDVQVSKKIWGLALPDAEIKAYATPISSLPLVVDTALLLKLRQTGKFEVMSLVDEQREPAFEMQSIWLQHLFHRRFGDNFKKYPAVLPIYVGKNTLPATCGKEVLQELFYDPEIAVVVSADLNRWGKSSGNIFYSSHARTRAKSVPMLSKYLPQPDSTDLDMVARDMMWVKMGEKNVLKTSPLREMANENGACENDPPVYEVIAAVDHLCMHALTMEPGRAYTAFTQVKQLLSTRTIMSSALSVALCVLESMFGHEARARSRSPLMLPVRSPERPSVAGQNMNLLPWDTMSRSTKLKLLALLAERRYMMRGRPVFLRYDRDRNTDKVSCGSYSFMAAYIVLD
ncbi:hypothetical protein KEM56_005723 [Ascosphaera pollenicola]|nr:hypothetical protein KEM56_005723 [Ascosphaera pollenicola]